ncbi:MAG: signal peptidase II [Dehalococcoidales bacterium]|nr:signal peptidase II [Dehalococcoidales bacterium]
MGIIIFLITVFLDIAADQVTKNWIHSTLSPGQSLFDWGFFHFTLVYNTGSAFGLIRDANLMLAIFQGIGAVIVIAVLLYTEKRRKFWGGNWGAVALGLVFAGAVGNLIDRIHFGYVVDFIDCTYWPVFNIADSSATVGLIIIAVLLIFKIKFQEKANG